MSTKIIETLVRGVVIKGGKLLLCHTKGAQNTYLPGGHVEFGERTEDALVREIQEELGLHSSVGVFLGALEHCFVQKGETHCEINLLFELDINGVGEVPESKEDYIEFWWHSMADIENSKLEPASLRQCLGEWLKGESRWASY